VRKLGRERFVGGVVRVRTGGVRGRFLACERRLRMVHASVRGLSGLYRSVTRSAARV
jgi:hypothetical protein